MSNILRFRDVEEAIYTLIGFIPYLLAIYLVIHLDAEITTSLLLAGLFALLAHLTGYILLHRFGRQLTNARDVTGKAAASGKRTPVEIHDKSPDELLGIIRNFNVVIEESNLSSHNFKKLTAKLMVHARDIERYQEKIRMDAISHHRLSRYVDKSVADRIISSDEDILLENSRKEATILFADIRSFTKISEDMNPEDVIGFLNTYFDAMVKIVFNHQGVLDKFIGDELMATFGIFGDEDAGPLNAVHAAIAMQKRTQGLMSGFRLKKQPTFEIAIGINTGHVVLGNVGSKNRMDYTVIGDAVNVASRLQEIAKGSSIVVGEETYQRCKTEVLLQSRGEVSVKNRTSPIECYEVII